MKSDSRRERSRNLAAIALMVALSTGYLLYACDRLVTAAADPKGAESLTDNDSAQYLQIARDFAGGDYGAHYPALLPHRQPLYPALLAIAMKLRGEDLFALGCVSILAGLGSLWILYLGVRRLFHRRIAGIVAALFYASNGFILHNITQSLLTEPTYVLCALAMIFLILKYGATGRSRDLYLACAAAGLCYLTRPNGLFLILALVASALANEMIPWPLGRGRRPDQQAPGSLEIGRAAKPSPRHAVERLAVGALVLLAVTIPSWLPRVFLWENPVYHGYLSNYLWVDTYAQGHVGGPPRFGPSSYFATHGVLNILSRLRYGLWYSFVGEPWEHERVFHLLAGVGLVAALCRREKRHFILLLLFLIQMAPLIWTAVSNSDSRIYAGAILPFCLIWVGALVAASQRLLSRE